MSPSTLFCSLFLIFYLFTHERQREREREAETQAEGKQAPCREPDVGLDPRSPGSHPGPKAGAKPLGLGSPLSKCSLKNFNKRVLFVCLFVFAFS